jgi:hypothetical protein
MAIQPEDALPPRACQAIMAARISNICHAPVRGVTTEAPWFEFTETFFGS